MHSRRSRSQTQRRLIILLTTVSLAVSGKSDSLLVNPGFEETDSDGKPLAWTTWSGPGSITQTTNSFKGEKVLKINAPKEVTWRVSQRVPITPPGQYELEFFTKIAGAARLIAIWAFEDQNGGKIRSTRYWTRHLTEAQAANWTRVTAELDAPAGTKTIKITFYVDLETNDGKGFVLLDEVGLVRVGEADEAEATLPKGAKLVLQEDFSSGRIPLEWKVEGGNWKVENGALSGEKGMIFSINKVGSPNMRLEYTAWTEDETPCDLSALVSIDEPVPWSRLKGYFFGFGSKFNTKNSVLRRSPGSQVLMENGGPLEVFDDGIRPGVKHKIVAQRDHNELKFYVDGKLTLEANDPFYASLTGEMFGFYLWGKGFIDDIRVYSLSWKVGDGVPERDIDFQIHENFEGMPAGEASGFHIEKGAPVTRISDHPTWIYKKPSGTLGNDIVTDHCLEIENPSPESEIILSKPFPSLDSGVVEFDVLAENFGELKFSVRDANGGDLVALVITPDGLFMMENAEGRAPLRDTIRYQRRVFDADLRFRKNTWHTFRLRFSKSLRQITLLDHYSEITGDFPLGNQGDYLPLGSVNTIGEDGTEKAGSFSVSASGKTRMLLDNLIIFGPVGTTSVRGKPLTLPSAKLLDLDYPPRKDPFSLKSQSYRHLTRVNYRVTPMLRHFHQAFDKSTVFKRFKPAADAYNQSLVNLAFLEERINMLHRAATYSRNDEINGKIRPRLRNLDAKFKAAEQSQEDALNAYANAYLEEQKAEKLDAFHKIEENIEKQHENLDEEIKDCLRLLRPMAASEKIVACPAPPPTNDAVWNSENKRWERNGKPVACDYFSHGPGSKFDWDHLRTLGFQNFRDAGTGYRQFPNRGDDPPIEDVGRYVNPADRNWAWLKKLKDSKRKGLMMAAAGMNYAVTGAPKWWFDRNKDHDVIFTTATGETSDKHSWRGLYALNWWHPEVKKLVEEQFEAVGEKALNDRDAIRMIQIGGELKACLPGGLVPGYNKSAIQAFRERLKDKYGSIANLNRLWGAEYDGFDDIVPPAGPTKPSGLQYEFRKFTHDGFTGWLKSIGDAIHKHAPDIPTASDSQDTLGGGVATEAIDPVGYFRAIDVKLYHTYHAWDRKFVDRWHGQLGAALDTPWGTKEWLISQGSPHMFQTDKMRNNGLREKAMMMMWGGTLWEYYGISSLGNWQYTTGGVDPRLDRLIFTYIAPFYALYLDRRRRLGEAALTIPLAKPEIGLLETTSSYYNGLKVREGIRMIAKRLADEGWNFEFLYEQLLEEGKQNLVGTDLIFVPAGMCMPDSLAERLYAWVKNGGVLICHGGPPGVWNEYGRPSGRLANIFNANWAETNGRWNLETVKPFHASNGVKGWSADYGKGKIIVFDQFDAQTLDTLSDHVKQRVGCNDPDIQLCLREKDGVKHLYALNWSVDEPKDVEIFVKGRFESIIDEGLQLPLEVPFSESDGKTFFKTRLAPAGVTLFRLSTNPAVKALQGGLCPQPKKSKNESQKNKITKE